MNQRTHKWSVRSIDDVCVWLQYTMWMIMRWSSSVFGYLTVWLLFVLFIVESLVNACIEPSMHVDFTPYFTRTHALTHSWNISRKHTHSLTHGHIYSLEIDEVWISVGSLRPNASALGNALTKGLRVLYCCFMVAAMGVSSGSIPPIHAYPTNRWSEWWIVWGDIMGQGNANDFYVYNLN